MLSLRAIVKLVLACLGTAFILWFIVTVVMALFHKPSHAMMENEFDAFIDIVEVLDEFGEAQHFLSIPGPVTATKYAIVGLQSGQQEIGLFKRPKGCGTSACFLLFTFDNDAEKPILLEYERVDFTTIRGPIYSPTTRIQMIGFQGSTTTYIPQGQGTVLTKGTANPFAVFMLNIRKEGTGLIITSKHEYTSRCGNEYLHPCGDIYKGSDGKDCEGKGCDGGLICVLNEHTVIGGGGMGGHMGSDSFSWDCVAP